VLGTPALGSELGDPVQRHDRRAKHPRPAVAPQPAGACRDRLQGVAHLDLRTAGARCEQCGIEAFALHRSQLQQASLIGAQAPRPRGEGGGDAGRHGLARELGTEHPAVTGAAQGAAAP
jgi:hypothetical protein